MKNNPNPPVYSKVAYDIASKIASGEIKENERFSGRSLMSSHYGVSSETIRRAMRLLNDMGIIAVEQNIGAITISQSRAVEYVERHLRENDMLGLIASLETLIAKRDIVNNEIDDTMRRISDLGRRFRSSGAVRTYEFVLPANSFMVGKSIKALKFRNHTSGTIVAVKREGEILLSPNPDTVLSVGDVLVTACDITAVEDVSRYINQLGE